MTIVVNRARHAKLQHNEDSRLTKIMSPTLYYSALSEVCTPPEIVTRHLMKLIAETAYQIF